MSDRIQSAFNDIRADDALLKTTEAYLARMRKNTEKKQGYFQFLRPVAAFAVMLVLVVGIMSYRSIYYRTATFVSIDVNPSVELTLNRMDKVIAATAYNTDGEALLNAVDVYGKLYDKAVSILLSEMVAQGYFSDDALVTMTVQTKSDEKEQLLCDRLLQSVSGQSEAKVEVFPISQEIRETAHGCQMSAAKYLAIQELLEVDETATLEDYSDSSIQQIRHRTQTCRRKHGNDNPSSNGKRGSDASSSNGKHEGDSSSGSGKHGGDGSSGSGKHGSDDSSGNGKQGSNGSPGNGKQGRDDSSGNGKQGSDGSPGNGKQGRDDSSGNGKQGNDGSSGNGKQGRDDSSGNGKQGSNDSSGNGIHGGDTAEGNEQIQSNSQHKGKGKGHAGVDG